MSDTEETLEAPKQKKQRTPAQQETLKVARAKKAELDEHRLAEKERLKAEARFDALLKMFETVRVENPMPAPKAVKKRREPEPEDGEPKVARTKRQPEPQDEELERPKVKATANPATKEVFLRFY